VIIGTKNLKNLIMDFNVVAANVCVNYIMWFISYVKLCVPTPGPWLSLCPLRLYTRLCGEHNGGELAGGGHDVS